MKKSRIISLSHAEDLDGNGAQSIIYRYFNILKKPIPTWLDSGKIEDRMGDVICLRADYSDFLYYWAAIFAQNFRNFDKKWLSVNNITSLDFLGLWNEFSDLLFNNSQALEKINIKTYENILKLKEFLEDVKIVVISDIGFNSIFKNLFEPLVKSKIIVGYIDHHEHPDYARKFFQENFYLYSVENTICASEITKNLFLPNDQIANYIASLGMDSDFHRWLVPNSDKLQSVIGKYMDDYKVLDIVRKILVNGKTSSPEINLLYADIKLWEDKQIEFLFKNIFYEINNTFKGNKIEVIFGYSEMRPGRATTFIENNYKNFFGHDIDRTGKKNPNLILTLNKLTGKMNIKSYTFNVFRVAKEFNGGGHIERAGFQLPEEFNTSKKEKLFKLNEVNRNRLFNLVFEIFIKNDELKEN